MKNTIRLTHPAARLASREYEWRRNHGRKRKLTFAQLWNLFSDKSNSFADIATRVGLSRERVRKIYKKHFAEFLRAKGRYERVRLLHARENRVASQTFSGNDITSRVARVALKHGHTVTRLAGGNRMPGSPDGFLKRRLLINSRVCLIYNPASAYLPHRNENLPYARVMVPSSLWPNPNM